MFLTILTYPLTYQILDMNLLITSKDPPSNNNMTMHEVEGGGFQENEEETEDKETPQAHFLDTFVILQHCNGSRSMMTKLRKWRKKLSCKMPRIRPTGCITYSVDQMSMMCATKKINLYVRLQNLLPWQ